MKVGELVQLLSTVDPDKEVVVSNMSRQLVVLGLVSTNDDGVFLGHDSGSSELEQFEWENPREWEVLYSVEPPFPAK